MARIAKKQTFIVMSATGPMAKPTWKKEGRGFWGPEGEEKALAKAEKLALASPEGSRFYVFSTVQGFRKPPKVSTKVYGS